MIYQCDYLILIKIKRCSFKMAGHADDTCVIDDIKAFYPENTLIIGVKGRKDEHTAILRLKCTNKEEFKEWLKEYKISSGDTMRVSRGITTKGKTVVYKAWYRCQHNTEVHYHTVKKHSLRNTACETNFLVKIKSSVKGRRVRSQDFFRSEYPTEVTFHRKHNHLLHNTEAIKYKDVETTGNETVLNCWNDSLHFSPSSSETTSVDTKFSMVNTPILSASETVFNVNNEEQQVQNTDDAKEKLKEIFQIMTEKLERDPHNFVVAVHAMHKNSLQMKNYDSALCSAMHGFGKMTTSKKYTANIPVQPTSVNRRCSEISSRKCQQKGRPSKTSFTPEHGYSCKSSAKP